MNTTPFTLPFNGFAPDAMKDFFPTTDLMGTLTRGAMEATTESTRASLKGLQEASQTMMSHMKAQMNLSVETGRKFSEVDSLEDAFSLQTNYVKSAFENNLKNFSEMSELYTETLREAFAPLAKQARKAAKSAKAS